MATSTGLLASAGTLEDITAMVTDFYGGNRKRLEPNGADRWRVVDASLGKEAGGVAVVRKRGRYRFEMID